MLPASQLYSLVCNGSIIVNFNCDYCMVIDTNSIATQMHDISHVGDVAIPPLLLPGIHAS